MTRNKLSIFFITLMTATTLQAATGTQDTQKHPIKKHARTKSKSKRNKLKRVQKRTRISLGYARICTQRMLATARVAKRDQGKILETVMNKARPTAQKGRVDRKAFNILARQEIKTYKQAKKRLSAQASR